MPVHDWTRITAGTFHSFHLEWIAQLTISLKVYSAASFRVADRVQCYGEAFAPGDPLPELPLFYDPDWYVNLPLDATYAAAYQDVPKRWKHVIEAMP